MNIERAELFGRLENIVRVGVIDSVDAITATARVKYGTDSDGNDLLTNNLQWVVPMAGDDTAWSPPQPGEQVVFITPSGDMSAGLIIGALYQTLYPPLYSDQNIRAITFVDGTEISYDKTAKQLAISMTPGGAVSINGGLTVAGDVNITGSLVVNGVNFSLHTHTSAAPGSPTGPAQ